LKASELERLYVDRNQAFRSRLVSLLRPPRAKVFLTGQSGTGKSTETVRLQEELKSQQHVCVFDLSAKFEMTRLTIQELLGAGTWVALDAAAGAGMRPSEGLSRSAAVWGVSWDDKGVRISPKVLRNQTLGLVAQKTAEALKEIETALGRPTVLLYDGLEKLPLSTAQGIFCTNGQALAEWPVRALFVVPPLLLYSPEWLEAERHAAGVEFLPALPVSGPEGAEREAAWTFFVEIARRRLGEGFANLTPDLLTLAIEKGAGVPRQFLQILREAYLEAELEGDDSPDRDCFDRALARLRAAYVLKLDPRQTARLRDLHEQRPENLDHDDHPLLAMGCVLQYRAGPLLWHDSNPILQPV
jgi:hypothetical protein